MSGRWLRCVLLAFLTAIGLVEASGDDKGTISDVLAAQRANLLRINSIDVTARSSYTFGEAFRNSPRKIEPGSVQETVIRFRREGNKFRTDCDVSKPMSGGPLQKTLAYDGERYNFFNVREKTLEDSASFKNDSDYYVSLPVARPYYFVFEPSKERIFEVAGVDERWQQLAEGAQVLNASATVDGKECVTIRFSLPYEIVVHGKKPYVEVAFSKQDGFFPIEVKGYLEDGTLISTLRVPKLKVFDGPNGQVVVPLEISSEDRSPSGEKVNSQVNTIDELTLAVNSDIPDEDFRIPMAAARMYSVDGGRPVSLEEKVAREEVLTDLAKASSAGDEASEPAADPEVSAKKPDDKATNSVPAKPNDQRLWNLPMLIGVFGVIVGLCIALAGARRMRRRPTPPA